LQQGTHFLKAWNKGWLKNYPSISPLTEKETRCLGILPTKCPVFTGLLRTDYAKLFLYDP